MLCLLFSLLRVIVWTETKRWQNDKCWTLISGMSLNARYNADICVLPRSYFFPFYRGMVQYMFLNFFLILHRKQWIIAKLCFYFFFWKLLFENIPVPVTFYFFELLFYQKIPLFKSLYKRFKIIKKKHHKIPHLGYYSAKFSKQMLVCSVTGRWKGSFDVIN